MAVKIYEFGTLNGQTVKEYSISNSNITASVIEFGATLRKLLIKAPYGTVKDIVCGYDDLKSYINENGYLGATVGRYANRIANGKFKLNSKEYELYRNNGTAHLHGGKNGFSHRLWDAEIVDENSVRFTLFSPDMDEGYPGNLKIAVTYSIDADSLTITYSAITDKPTIINMTNHSYFNLDGYESDSVLNHSLYINSKKYDKPDDNLIPIGEPENVQGTVYDFSKERKIIYNYDHNFILNDTGYRLAAILKSEFSGIKMKVFTDMPAIQIYTSGNLTGVPLKNGVEKKLYKAICLETQYSPNTPNRPYMPQCTFDSKHPFNSVTKFSFVK